MHPYPIEEKHIYEAWRERKLNCYPLSVNRLIIDINNPIKLVDKEIDALRSSCLKTNLVFYRLPPDTQIDKQIVLSIADQLGLRQLDANLCADEDKISVIQNANDSSSQYVPYTNKALNWHTDGYYNPSSQRIHAFLMHCIHAAKNGGENKYLDPEIAFIFLRDENPEYITALMDENVMNIPANEINKKNIRSAQTGPVFYFENGVDLCMRYTSRKHSIEWKKDKIVQSALSCLQEILTDNPYIFSYRLRSGEGVICNNVLHNRSAFEDGDEKNTQRLLYRGRFYNRITDSLTSAGLETKKCYG